VGADSAEDDKNGYSKGHSENRFHVSSPIRVNFGVPAGQQNCDSVQRRGLHVSQEYLLIRSFVSCFSFPAACKVYLRDLDRIQKSKCNLQATTIQIQQLKGRLTDQLKC
jgi:hypothetical protein